MIENRSNKKGKYYYLSMLLIVFLCFALLLGCTPSEPEGTGENEPEEKTSFPERTIRIIVYQAAGGGADLEARALQPYLQNELGVPVIVENVTGAGGSIGTAEAYKAEPDGYTLLVEVCPMTIIRQVAYDGNFDMDKFTYIKAWLAENYVIVTAKNSPYKTLKDLIDTAKKQTLIHGNPGTGSSVHFQSEVFKKDLGLDYVEVPYDGTAPTLAAMLGGDVDFCITTSARAIAGKDDFNLLATIAPERLSFLPEVPTIFEEGYDASVVTMRRGVLAPPNLPDDIKNILEEAFSKALATEGFSEWVKKTGTLIGILNSAEYREEALRQLKLVKDNVEIFTE